jgi:hypothetical protein
MAELNRSWIKPLLLTALLIGAGMIACAQSSGSLTGKVTDWYAQPLDGATVVVRNETTGAEARTTSTKDGRYRFAKLGPGEYTLEAVNPQLGRAHVDGILVAAGHEARVLAALQMTLPQRAPIQAAFHDMDPATPVVTTTLTGEQVQQLPLTGRRWQDFEMETPTASTQTGGESPAALRGAVQQPTETTIDGASQTLAFGAQGKSAFGGGGALAGMSSSAIREVQTTAGNVEVEDERAAAGTVRVESMRGSNGLHGQGFFFDRQNAWGAQNPFTTREVETPAVSQIAIPTFASVPYTPVDDEFTFGIGLGGHIRRDRLFWFAAVDGYRRDDPGLAMVKHPYLAEPAGTPQAGFFAQPSSDQMTVLCARLELTAQSQPACNNAIVQGLAAYSSMLGTLAGLLGPAPRTAQQWVGFGRLDWQATERHHFTAESIGALWNSPGGGLTGVSENYGNHSFGNSHATEQWILGRWEAFLTPNLLLTTQGSWGRDVLSERPETPSTYEQTLLAPNVYGQLPQIVVDSRYGFTIGNPSRFGQGNYPDERLLQGQQSVDWVHNGWLIKAGGQVRNISDKTSLLRNETGTYTYSNVENFISDALVYQTFGLKDALDPYNQHNCDETGKTWRDTTGTLHGLGNLPCYSSYTQLVGPTDWQLGTNDWAGYATAQWQPKKRLAFSAGLRWEREQLPPPIPALVNPELPLTARLPSLSNNWGPRLSMAWETHEGHWPVLRLGYGMYYGRTENATVETALTQTGSTKGDLNIFMRPTDDLPNHPGGAPPFPYVLQGAPANIVKPGVVEFAPKFQNPEIHQAVAGIEESLPGHIEVTASALMSLGRRLPVSIDENFNPAANPGTITYAVCDNEPTGSGDAACSFTGAGPIKAPLITVPFYASWPTATGIAGRLNSNYQQITHITDRANSTYEAGVLRINRYSRRGLSLRAHYTYAHAMDWNPNESTLASGSDPLDPQQFNLEYGTSNLDVRHSARVIAIYETPWKLKHLAGQLANGWMISGIGQFHGGLPYTMRVSGSVPDCFVGSGITPCTAPAKLPSLTNNATIFALGPGINGSGGDSRVYGVGSNHIFYNIGRNTFRYPASWKADLRLGKEFDLGHMRDLELLAESFNLFNHQNVTEVETTGYSIAPGNASGGYPTLNFLTGLKTNTTAFGQPLNINGTNFYRERQIQVGLRMRF